MKTIGLISCGVCGEEILRETDDVVTVCMPCWRRARGDDHRECRHEVVEWQYVNSALWILVCVCCKNVLVTTDVLLEPTIGPHRRNIIY